MANAKHDGNFVPTIIGVSSTDGTTTVPVYVNPSTHRVLVEPTIVGGVSSVSNVDGTVTVSPTTGAVVVSLPTSQQNLWTRTGVGNNDIKNLNSFGVRIGSNTVTDGLFNVGTLPSLFVGTGAIFDDGSGNITGSGTAFTTELKLGDLIVSDDTGFQSQIIAINSDTSLTVKQTIGGSGAGFTYNSIAAMNTSASMRTDSRDGNNPAIYLDSTPTGGVLAALVTEGGGALIDYGINYNQMGSGLADFNQPGGYFRIDTRGSFSPTQLFTVNHAVASGVNNGTIDMALGTSGGLSLGSYANANNTQPVGGMIMPGSLGVGTNNPSFPAEVIGDIKGNAFRPTSAQTVVNAASTGNVTYSQPFQGASYKKVIAYCAAAVGTASYTFPTAFVRTPTVVSTNGLATSIVSAISTTAMTINGTASTGFILVEGY